MGNNITEENYKEVVLKRSIITCWVLLALCLVIKLFGGNFFNIVCTNERFIGVCNYIENSWLYCLMGFISYNLTNFLMFASADINKKSNKTLKIISVCILELYWVMKMLNDIDVLNIDIRIYAVLDFIILSLALILYTKDLKQSVLANVLMFVFLLISSLTKNLSLSETITENALTTFIFSIDYYIMYSLYFLYTKQIKLKRRIK